MDIQKILFPVIVELIKLLTPQLSKNLRQFVEDFYWEARETSNPFDDVAASALIGLLGMDTPDLDEPIRKGV